PEGRRARPGQRCRQPHELPLHREGRRDPSQPLPRSDGPQRLDEDEGRGEVLLELLAEPRLPQVLRSNRSREEARNRPGATGTQAPAASSGMPYPRDVSRRRYGSRPGQDRKPPRDGEEAGERTAACGLPSKRAGNVVKTLPARFEPVGGSDVYH